MVHHRPYNDHSTYNIMHVIGNKEYSGISIDKSNVYITTNVIFMNRSKKSSHTIIFF